MELQGAVIIYLLELTACRPGSKETNKKDSDPSGIGIANLRVNNITLSHENNKVRLQFITKGGKKYDKIHEVSERVYKLLKKYRSGSETLAQWSNMKETEKEKRPLFNQIEYSEFAKKIKDTYGVELKDIRTYVATNRFKQELNSFSSRYSDADEKTRIEELKNFHQNARKIVQDLLLHINDDSRDYYIDPRITVEW